MRLSDPQKFTIVSAVIVVLVTAVTGYAASGFFRRAMIERELDSMHELIRSVASEEEAEGNLSTGYLKGYSEDIAQKSLQRSFRTLTRLPGFFQTKVFNSDQVIAWSSASELIGTQQSHHLDAVARALLDDLPAAFNPVLPGMNESLIEFYVPFRLEAEGDAVAGVVSIYRSSDAIDASIRQGVYLLWLVTGLGGIVLYAALYRLFLTVYRDRDSISSRFERFASDNSRLIQMEKLSAMGQMVTEIAHQLNNPLVGVINLTELAEREIGNQTRVRELLGQVRAAGEHCREYVQRILGLSQLTRSEMQVIDFGRLVQETVAFFRQSLGNHPIVEFEAPADTITCKVDPALMRNALFNLIHNASQADPNGPILVSLSREQGEGRAGCSLTVSDRGPGIPPGAADKLFTPFFTTRTGGTGLGLSIAQQIAVLHGGSIKAENRPDGGSQFTIWIPESRDAA
jgi:two-component system, NtrC family, sensor histidine kinase HydH